MANNNPVWLKPLWRRVALVVFCAAWAGFELYMGSPGWALLAAAMAAYGAWLYLYDWKDPDAQDGQTGTSSGSRD